jgi:hypothetical protein
LAVPVTPVPPFPLLHHLPDALVGPPAQPLCVVRLHLAIGNVVEVPLQGIRDPIPPHENARALVPREHDACPARLQAEGVEALHPAERVPGHHERPLEPLPLLGGARITSAAPMARTARPRAVLEITRGSVHPIIPSWSDSKPTPAVRRPEGAERSAPT